MTALGISMQLRWNIVLTQPRKQECRLGSPKFVIPGSRHKCRRRVLGNRYQLAQLSFVILITVCQISRVDGTDKIRTRGPFVHMINWFVALGFILNTGHDR